MSWYHAVYATNVIEQASPYVLICMNKEQRRGTWGVGVGHKIHTQTLEGSVSSCVSQPYLGAVLRNGGFKREILLPNSTKP